MILGNIRADGEFPHEIIKRPSKPRPDGLPTVYLTPKDAPEGAARMVDNRLGAIILLNGIRELRGQRKIPMHGTQNGD